MIRDTFRIRPSGLPILSNREIDRIAEHVLADYDPDLLSVPQPVPIDLIMESYFGLVFDYLYLSHDGYILGATVFKDGFVRSIFNPERQQAEEHWARRGDILIDSRLLEPSNTRRKRATMAHECGHWLFHQEYHRRSEGDAIAASMVVDKKDDMEDRNENYLVKDREWLEHHANYFSGAILMPESMFRKAAASEEVQKMVWIRHARSCAEARDETAARCLADIFLVSVEATRLRMQQLGITMGPGMSPQEFAAAREQALAQKKKRRSKRSSIKA